MDENQSQKLLLFDQFSSILILLELSSINYIILMNCTKIFVLSFLCFVCFSSIKNEKGMELLQINNLQFRNITGANVTDQMVKSFIKIANDASFYYDNNIQKNLKYIKFRMDQLYGQQRDNFYVYIQTQEVLTNFRIWVLIQRVFAGFSQINKKYPTWSYYFQRNFGQNKIAQYTYISKDQVGKNAYKNNFYQLIKLAINTYEGDECTCQSSILQNIGNVLQKQTQNAWSIICDTKGISSALIMNYEQRWVNIKVKNCYYLMYNF